MKIAIIGSRSLTVNNLEKYLPDGVTEIISGGAKGIDSCAKVYAESNGIKFTVFPPDYKRYKKGGTAETQLADHRICRLCHCLLGRYFKRYRIRYPKLQKKE